MVVGTCCGSKVDYVCLFGVDHVIDYEKINFTEQFEWYDVLLDIVGDHSIVACRNVLIFIGVNVTVGGPLSRTVCLALFGGKQMQSILSDPKETELEEIRVKAESGELRPVVDRVFGLDEVRDAMRYFVDGRVRGKIAINVR